MRLQRIVCSVLVPLACACVVLSPPPVHAGKLLDKIKSTQTLTIGYRPDAPPFSYTAPDGKVIGYAIESCEQIAAIMGDNLGIKLKLRYVPVLYFERMGAVQAGTIDLECADTTSTRQRREQYGVSFLSPYFITGVRILAHARTDIQTERDLKGKKLAYTVNTSSEAISKKQAALWGVAISPCGPDNENCFRQLERGSVDAWIADDITLQISRANSGSPTQYIAVGKLLSIEPLAPMYKAGDPELSNQLETAMRQFMTSGAGRTVYQKWFEQPMAHKGINLKLHPTPLLQKYMRRPSSEIGEYVVY